MFEKNIQINRYYNTSCETNKAVKKFIIKQLDINKYADIYANIEEEALENLKKQKELLPESTYAAAKRDFEKSMEARYAALFRNLYLASVNQDNILLYLPFAYSCAQTSRRLIEDLDDELYTLREAQLTLLKRGLAHKRNATIEEVEAAYKTATYDSAYFPIHKERPQGEIAIIKDNTINQRLCFAANALYNASANKISLFFDPIADEFFSLGKEKRVFTDRAEDDGLVKMINYLLSRDNLWETASEAVEKGCYTDSVATLNAVGVSIKELEHYIRLFLAEMKKDYLKHFYGEEKMEIAATEKELQEYGFYSNPEYFVNAVYDIGVEFMGILHDAYRQDELKNKISLFLEKGESFVRLPDDAIIDVDWIKDDGLRRAYALYELNNIRCTCMRSPIYGFDSDLRHRIGVEDDGFTCCPSFHMRSVIGVAGDMNFRQGR